MSTPDTQTDPQVDPGADTDPQVDDSQAGTDTVAADPVDEPLFEPIDEPIAEPQQTRQDPVAPAPAADPNDDLEKEADDIDTELNAGGKVSGFLKKVVRRQDQTDSRLNEAAPVIKQVSETNNWNKFENTLDLNKLPADVRAKVTSHSLQTRFGQLARKAARDGLNEADAKAEARATLRQEVKALAARQKTPPPVKVGPGGVRLTPPHGSGARQGSQDARTAEQKYDAGDWEYPSVVAGE